MGRNIGTSGARVPSDPLWIDIPRSDGDQRWWPTNTTYIEDGGEINWMKVVDLDDDVALRWRLGVGNKISLDRSPEGEDHSRAILRAWPAGYRMYDHHKGKVGAPRHDIYLYGPQHKRFRSINEFIPHAIWLCRDETMDAKNCCCKYCKKLPQKVISSALDSIIQASSSRMSVSAPPRSQGNDAAGPSSGSPAVQGRDIYSALQKQGWVSRERVRDSTSLAQRKAQREQRVRQPKGKRKDEAPKVFASVQKELQPMKELRPSENVSDMPMLADRNRDLRAVYSRSANDKMGVLGWDDDSEAALTSQAVQWGVVAPPAQPNRDTPSLRRYYRENEIVWVQLPGQGIPVASLGSTQEMNISIWPGMVKGSKIKNTPIPVFQPPQSGVPPPQGKPLSSASLNNATLSEHIQSVPATSSAGVAGNPDPSFASSQLPPSTSPVRPQSSSGPPSALPGASALTTNGSLPSSAPLSSTPGLPPTGVPLSHTSSPAPNAFGTPAPSLPSRSNNAATPATLPSNSGFRSPNSGDWIVRESIVYTIQLSGLDVRVEVPAAKVLPYLATAPADNFVAWLKLVHEHLNFEDDTIRHFDPMDASRRTEQDGASEDETISRASQAISAYALALQTASHVCNDWSLTDKWDFEYVPPVYEKGPVRVNVASNNGAVHSTPISSPALPPPAEFSSPMKTNSHTFSLASAIQDAGRSNAQGPTSFSQKMDLNATTGSRPAYTEISGTNDLMTEQEVRDIAEGVLGVSPGDAQSVSSVPGALVQVRFQGMWWGSERIWVDDFVRVKVPRGALAPNGAPNVYKPSGWGRANKDVASKLKAIQQARIEAGFDKGKGREGVLDSLEVQETHSVGSRGIFMKVGGIFVVDVPKPDSSRKKEGRICGMLYELAELDWDETEPELKEQYELEKEQREVYLEQAHGTADPAAFKASVNESLLPSNPGKPRSLKTSSSVQPSPPPHYIMPQAPKGYRFRPILRAGCEAVLNLSLIAGRYYPRIIGHPLLAPKFTQELSASRWDLNEKQRTDIMSAMSLEGLSAGHYNAVDPQYHKKSRTQMLDDAERGALRDMDRFKREMWAAYSQAPADVEYLEEDDDMDEGESEDSIEEMEMDELAMNVD